MCNPLLLLLVQCWRAVYRRWWGEKYAGSASVEVAAGDALLALVGVAGAEAVFVATSYDTPFLTGTEPLLMDMLKAGECVVRLLNCSMLRL